MKKLTFALFLILTLVMTSNVATSINASYVEVTDECEPTVYNAYCLLVREIYEGEFVTLEGTYSRIEYDDELNQWFGVVKLLSKTSIYSDRKGSSGSLDLSYNTIYFDLSRELEELHYMKLAYSTEWYCDGYKIYNTCFGTEYMPRVRTGEYYYKTESQSFLVNDDDISVGYILINDDSNKESYYWKIKVLEKHPIDIIAVLEYGFILTDEEILQLGLDLKDQLDYETNEIAKDTSINNDAKIILLDELKEEYTAHPDFTVPDYYFSQVCEVGDTNCIIIAEDSDGEYNSTLENEKIMDLEISWNWFKDIFQFEIWPFLYPILLGGLGLGGLLSILKNGFKDTMIGLFVLIQNVIIGSFRVIKTIVLFITYYPLRYIIIGLFKALKWILGTMLNAF